MSLRLYVICKPIASVHCFLSITCIVSCLLSPLGYNTLSPSYKEIHIILDNNSATFTDQFDNFCAIIAINSIYFCIIDDTLSVE